MRGPSVRLINGESVLVESGCTGGVVECCDHETGHWDKIESRVSPVGHVVPGLIAGHTYSFRLEGSQLTSSVTLPHETRWQQEQFERRYEELYWIGE